MRFKSPKEPQYLRNFLRFFPHGIGRGAVHYVLQSLACSLGKGKALVFLFVFISSLLLPLAITLIFSFLSQIRMEIKIKEKERNGKLQGRRRITK